MNRVLYFTSMISQEEFSAEMQRAKKELQIEFDYRLNRVHRGEEYLNFGFLFLDSSVVYNAFLGYNLDGTERIERKSIEKETPLQSWADDEEEEILLPPLILFPEIRFSPAQPPEVEEEFSRETICCRDFPKALSLKRLEKEASFYSTFPNYPKSKEKIINKRRVVFLSFHPQSNDAQYALLMLKTLNLDSYPVRFTQSYKNSKKTNCSFNKNSS